MSEYGDVRDMQDVQDVSAGDCPAHKNIQFPELHDKEALEELMRVCGSPTRIAGRLGCGRSTVSMALKRFGIKCTGYVVDESMRKRLRLN